MSIAANTSVAFTFQSNKKLNGSKVSPSDLSKVVTPNKTWHIQSMPQRLWTLHGEERNPKYHTYQPVFLLATGLYCYVVLSALHNNQYFNLCFKSQYKHCVLEKKIFNFTVFYIIVVIKLIHICCYADRHLCPISTLHHNHSIRNIKGKKPH